MSVQDVLLHRNIQEGYTIDEIAYLIHSGATTIKSYISLPDNKIPEDKEIVREQQHREAIEAKQKEIDDVRKLKKEGKVFLRLHK